MILNRAFVAAMAVAAAWFFAALPSACAQAQSAPPAFVKPPALAPEVAFGRFIALIRGHLLTGDELAAQRQWDAAAVHLGFPREEVYGVIRQDLRSYNVPAFDGALRELVRTAKARDAKQFARARQNVEKALAAADASLKARQFDWTKFTATVALEVLKTVPDEYEDAISKGRIVRPISYQTARGFILQADRMFESIASDLQAKNAAALTELRAGLSQLKQTFAALTAPKSAVMDEVALQAAMARIEQAARALL